MSHPVHKDLRYKRCIRCGEPASHKLRESFVPKGGHAPTGAVCCKHFEQVVGSQENCDTEEMLEAVRDGKWCLHFWHVWTKWRQGSGRNYRWGYDLHRICRRCGKKERK